ncbi:FHA domain-containing protein, partial [Oscillospiraceae bacterium OttesenSCG-928-F05]|nr:FHA domain-containing protein [Oscillospiraceae bacterium OttesenSCG-928-F05]
ALGGLSDLGDFSQIVRMGAFMGVVFVIGLIALIGAMYAFNSFTYMFIGRKTGLEKDWMAFVPIARAIYRLQMIGEAWWKLFFLELWYVYGWLLSFIINAISAGKWATFADVLVTIYYLCCIAYNIYYRYLYYKAFNIQPALSLGVVAMPPLPFLIDILVGYTNLFHFGEYQEQNMGKVIGSAMNARQASPAQAPRPAPPAGGTGITCLSGMYAGQDFTMAAGDELIIGRDATMSNIILDQNADKVSRKHCGITYDAARNAYQVTDYSTNGTFIDGGNRLAANVPTTLQRGTVIALGSRENRFKLS